MNPDQWLLVLVPIVTGIFAVLGSWFGSRFGRTTEHKQWVRSEKRNAYGDFLGAVLQAQRESEPGISGSRRPPYEMMLGLSEKQGLVQVVGTDEIVELCNDVVVAVGVLSFVLSETYGSENTKEQTTHMIVKSRETDQEAFKQLVKAIRADLRID
ncbi:hypothetical protein [Arthrobacter sp. CAN_C5]|uniref:hypothetical protein n=1 Tax=Arthrobacter sp. CAN_C5 TaxID=2760706 RepID=UPI001AEA83F1|nr:hypothetical protein [Arthrobacter sp. CAN_C5]MBP2215962.1 hypothetical protein [Arthrobacter sp. CAN_C5]